MSISTEREIRDAYAGQAVAEQYSGKRFTTPLTRLLHDRQVATIRRLFDQLQPAHVLEVAPGPGRLTRALNPPGNLVCLEINDGMIAAGKAACVGRVEWVRGNAFALPFAAAFDLIYSFRFVRHFRLSDRQRLYAEFRRVLKPHGLFVLDAVNERLSRPLRTANAHEYPIYDELYRPETLAAELRANGFAPVELRPVQKWFSWQSRVQMLIGPRLPRLAAWLIRAAEALPRREGLEWIVTCRRA